MYINYYYSHAVKRKASTINSSRSIVISVTSPNRRVNQNHIVVFIAIITFPTHPHRIHAERVQRRSTGSIRESKRKGKEIATS